MKKINLNRKKNRSLRHKKTINKIKIINNKLPRMIVTKSNSHIYAQLIDNETGKILVSSSSLQMKLSNGNVESAKLVGEDIGKKILKLNIKKISFDKNGCKYHGRVSAIADTARKAGLEF